VLIGTLCDRAGLNNKILLEKIRKLMRMCYEVYEAKLLYRVLIDAGVKSKNLKAVAENLDEISDYLIKHGIDTTTKKDFALFITCADSPDKGVRENSLKVFGEAYTIIGEDVWRMFPKDIPIKVKGLLESRFKQVAKRVGTKGNQHLKKEEEEKKRNASLENQRKLLEAEEVIKAQKRASVPVGVTGLKFNKPPIEKEETESIT